MRSFVNCVSCKAGGNAMHGAGSRHGIECKGAKHGPRSYRGIECKGAKHGPQSYRELNAREQSMVHGVIVS